MNRRKVAGIFILIQALLFLLLSGKFLVTAATPVLIPLAWWGSQRYRFGKRGHIAFLIAGLFSLLLFRAMRLWEQQDPHGIFEFFAEYLLLVQIAELFRKDRPDVADYFPGLGVITVACTLAQMQIGLRREVIELLAAVVAIFALVLLRPVLAPAKKDVESIAHKKRTTIYTLGFIILTAGWVVAEVLHQSVPTVTNFLIKVSEPRRNNSGAGVQYVRYGGLDAVRTHQELESQSVALKVLADSPPGYMRGTVFEYFDGVYWRNYTRGGRPIKVPPAPAIPSDMDIVQGHSVHYIRNDTLPPYRKLTVKSDPSRGSNIFTPLGTEIITGDTSTIILSQNGAVLNGISNEEIYSLYVTDRLDDTLNDFQRRRLVFPINDPSFRQLYQLSDEICGKASTTLSKVRAVEQFFDKDFEYSLEENLELNRGGRSRLAAFLLDRRPAHCEYFATGAAALLRYQGVPTRYVVGYRVYEENDEEKGEYVARNRNAHAWVEAYDDQRGVWITVEATPGIAGPEETSNLLAEQGSQNEEASEEEIAEQETRWSMAWLTSGGFWDAMKLVRNQLVIPIGLLTATISIALYRARKYSRSSAITHPPESKHLKQANRLAAKLGLVRAPSETWHRFADRISRASGSADDEAQFLKRLADWYVQYADVRYREQTVTLIKDLGPPPQNT